jgi:hypothetical protein
MTALGSALETIERASALLDRTASRLARPPSIDGAADTVDLSAEMIALLEARNTGAVGVKLAQAVDDLQKTALSVFG